MSLISMQHSPVKSRRRQGVSDLLVPPLHDQWRLTMTLDEDGVEIFDFPRPPSRDDNDSSSDGHSASSSPATTPATSPTTPNRPRSITRCKTIKPLIINKRALSPQTPINGDDDDDFYASHARNFVTLSPPLPPSFPRSMSPSIRTSPGPAPDCPLPATPSTPTHSRTLSSSSSCSPPNYSRPMSRPPPRSSIPADARLHDSVCSGDFFNHYATYAPLIQSRSHTPLVDLLATDDDEVLSLSPMMTVRNPDLDSDSDPLDLDVDPAQASLDKPLPLPPYKGWHTRPSDLASIPPLRSRWSTSTLSSIRDPPRNESSPFNFAKRYFSAPRVPRSSPVKENKSPKSKGKGKGKLTVGDVRVLLSPPAPVLQHSQSDSGCFSTSSSLPRISTDSTFITTRSEMGHSNSNYSSDEDDDADSITGLRPPIRRRKPIPAFLGMHAR